MKRDLDSFVLSWPWARPILALISWVKGWGKKPDPLAGFSRKHRRALTFASSAEERMRRERTAIRWAKRHKNRPPSDNGAKYRRAYYRGFGEGQLAALEEMSKRVTSRATRMVPQAERDRIWALRKAA